MVHNERMAWLGLSELGVILDAARTDSVVTLTSTVTIATLAYRAVTGRGVGTIQAPQARPWGARAATGLREVTNRVPDRLSTIRDCIRMKYKVDS